MPIKASVPKKTSGQPYSKGNNDWEYARCAIAVGEESIRIYFLDKPIQDEDANGNLVNTFESERVDIKDLPDFPKTASILKKHGGFVLAMAIRAVTVVTGEVGVNTTDRDRACRLERVVHRRHADRAIHSFAHAELGLAAGEAGAHERRGAEGDA